MVIVLRQLLFCGKQKIAFTEIRWIGQPRIYQNTFKCKKTIKDMMVMIIGARDTPALSYYSNHGSWSNTNHLPNISKRELGWEIQILYEFFSSIAKKVIQHWFDLGFAHLCFLGSERISKVPLLALLICSRIKSSYSKIQILPSIITLVKKSRSLVVLPRRWSHMFSSNILQTFWMRVFW